MEAKQFEALSAYLGQQFHAVKDTPEESGTAICRLVEDIRRKYKGHRPLYLPISNELRPYYPAMPDDANLATVQVSDWVGEVKRGNAAPFRVALLNYYWREHPADLQAILRAGNPDHEALKPFLAVASSPPLIARRVVAKPTSPPFPFSSGASQFHERDWEIALLRVKAEKHARTGILDFSKLRIDSVPEEALKFDWLRALDLSVTLITRLPDLSGYSELRSLDCSYTMVDSLDGIDNPALHTLWCGISGIASLEGIEKCDCLTRLYLGSTKVSDLGPARGLPIELLTCENTAISDFSPIAGNDRLTYLDASDCHIASLSGLRKCTTLAHLVLNGCHVEEEEVTLWAMPALKELMIFQGDIPNIPANILSRSFDENCLPRVREYLRRLPY